MFMDNRHVYLRPESYLGEALCEYMLAESPDGSGSDLTIQDIDFVF